MVAAIYMIAQQRCNLTTLETVSFAE